MRPTKGWDWRIEKNGVGDYSWEQVTASILMDIRDELKLMNMRLQCPDFIAVPRLLREIRRNTAKPRKRRLKVVRRSA